MQNEINQIVSGKNQKKTTFKKRFFKKDPGRSAKFDRKSCKTMKPSQSNKTISHNGGTEFQQGCLNLFSLNRLLCVYDKKSPHPANRWRCLTFVKPITQPIVEEKNRFSLQKNSQIPHVRSIHQHTMTVCRTDTDTFEPKLFTRLSRLAFNFLCICNCVVRTTLECACRDCSECSVERIQRHLGSVLCSSTLSHDRFP